MHAAPRPPKGSDGVKPPTRLATLTAKEEKDGEPQILLELPPVDAAGHLIGYLFEVGPSSAGEMITFQELEAWQNATGTRLTSWEAITLRKLSGAYLGELQAAEDPKRPAPYLQSVVKSREVVAGQLKSIFDRFEQQDIKAGPLVKPKRLRGD